MKVRKKPVVVEAITFDELVAHGLFEAKRSSDNNVPVVAGMPWSFKYKGHPITHENDDCYIIPTLEGSMHFKRGDYLITGVKGEIYPIKKEIFDETYDIVNDSVDSLTVRNVCIDCAMVAMTAMGKIEGASSKQIATVAMSLEPVIEKVMR